MQAFNGLGLLSVGVVAFLAMFACASLVRARGVLGVLAAVGAIAIGIALFSGLRDLRLLVGGAGMFLGIALGGKLSDYLELRRMTRLRQIEQARRNAEMKGGIANDQS